MSQEYILVEGSLVVVASNKFILRLDQPGDVVGEIAVIQSASRSADVVAEVDCRLIAFPAKLFEVDPHSTQASILYVLPLSRRCSYEARTPWFSVKPATTRMIGRF
jgi:CRP-like cAMP-binding protein